MLPWCQAHGVGAIVYSPMQSGLLSGRMTRERVAALPEGDWRRSHPNYQEPLLTRNLAIAAALADVAARHGRSAGEAAIAWTLRQPAVTGAIVGARTAAQVDGIIGAGTFRLSAAEIAEIEARDRGSPGRDARLRSRPRGRKTTPGSPDPGGIQGEAACYDREVAPPSPRPPARQAPR